MSFLGGLAQVGGAIGGSRGFWVALVAAVVVLALAGMLKDLLGVVAGDSFLWGGLVILVVLAAIFRLR